MHTIFPEPFRPQNGLIGHKLHSVFSLRYIITRQLGQGGQGIVFEGIRRLDNRKLAIKFISKTNLSSDSWISLSKTERIPMEVYILSQYSHEGMITLIDYFDHKDFIYIVMELFGSSLENSLDDVVCPKAIQTQIPKSIKPKSPLDLFEFIEKSVRLTERQASFILKQVVSVIEYLHSKSIVHGDVKDENILIDDKLTIKMIDFGSSKIFQTTDRLNRFQGTINYVSPEILRGGYFSGKSNDIWCIGILLYTMLTGQVPFASINDIRSLKRRKLKVFISNRAIDLLDSILQEDPSARPSASEILSHDWFKSCQRENKKVQLQEKRARKSNDLVITLGDKDESVQVEDLKDNSTVALPPVAKLESVFMKLSPQQIEDRKRCSRLPLKMVEKEELEVGFESLYGSNLIDFPKRPNWSNSDSKKSLEEREENAFKEWKDRVYRTYPLDSLSYFEHNLEVWRQLWRVVELSDIILFVVDARHPVLHFPPTLYDYVTREMKKSLILVFNKIDLVDQKTLEAWKKYFTDRFPLLITAGFSCYPKECLRLEDLEIETMKKQTTRKGKRFFKAVGVADILQVCKTIKLDSRKSHIDWDSLIKKVTEQRLSFEEKERHAHSQKEDPESFLGRSRHRQKMEIDTSLEDDESSQSDDDVKIENSLNVRIDNSIITLGTIGHPNVGKSSLINGLLGKKAVSVSKTPGHTKHFQTIHISKDIRLCDCPGLVFPSLIPKPLQILSGMYKISQVQEPYTSVTYLAERIPLIDILQLKHPDQNESSFFWSGWMICEAFALQRGFLTPKVARPDVYRAANLILRMANDGRLLLIFRPTGFWKTHQDTKIVHQKVDLEKPDFFKEIDSASDNDDSIKDADLDSDSEDIISLDQSFAPLAALDE